MRSILKVAVLLLALLALLIPLVAYAGGPCPDDPELSKECSSEAPPYFVVINRSAEYLYPDRPGTGCQPIILEHPDCKDCTQPECDAPDVDIEAEVCKDLPATAGDTLFVMCCACATDPGGEWMYRTYELDGVGGCTMVDDWADGLPPGTGIDLPAPVIAGGLALLGAALLAAGLFVRRRSLSIA